MGNVGGKSTPTPEAIERRLSWGPVLRGHRWGDGPDLALLLHEPGADLDAWGSLPAQLARHLALGIVAVDLPGHGLSDDPWEPARLPDLLRALSEIVPTTERRFIIAAGPTALATLEFAADFAFSGLVCLSPDEPGGVCNPQRSPAVPKLIVAGALALDDLDTARRLASTCGGWAVVTSLPVADRGTTLLTSAWGGRLIEEIVMFLRDCQRRPAPETSLMAGTRQQAFDGT